MKPLGATVAAAVAAALLVAGPVLAEQRKPSSSGNPRAASAAGQARRAPSPRGVAEPRRSAPSRPSDPGPGSQGMGGDRRGPRQGEVGRAVPRQGDADRPRTPAAAGPTRASNAGTDQGQSRPRAVPRQSRPRGDRPTVGRAVPRRSVPRVIVTPRTRYYSYSYGYYPYGYGYPGYGTFGLGYFYYDPYWWGYPGYGYGHGYGYGYGYGPYYRDYGDTGQLRLKVKPQFAEVFVDGYYVGTVDEFDGIFQRLRLETGGHRIEIRADGYEPLVFDALISPFETVTYRGQLRRLP